MALNKI